MPSFIKNDISETIKIRQTLLSMGNSTYRDFMSSLIPTVPKDNVIGIPIPLLRKYAGEIAGTEEAIDFVNALPHKYFEENNLHAFLIEKIGDFSQTDYALEQFLPFVDNWATCDSMCPKVLGKHPDELLLYIRRWMASDHVYTVRYGMELLMKFYLDANFCKEFPAWVAAVSSDEYYIRMMQSWYFATALAKQPEETLPFFTGNRLAEWVHIKAIQKAIESRRISPELKIYIKKIKTKRK